MEYNKDEEVQIDILKGFEAIWRKKNLILSVVIFTTCIGWLFTLLFPLSNTYSSSASVYLIAGSDDSSISTVSQMTYAATALNEYAEILKSTSFLEKIVVSMEDEYELSIGQLQSMISSSMATTTVMEISISSGNPEMSIDIANEVTEEFVNRMNSAAQLDAIQILDSARSASVSNKSWMVIVVSFVIGLLITVGPIVVIEMFSPKIRSVSQCVNKGKDGVLGILPEFK